MTCSVVASKVPERDHIAVDVSWKPWRATRIRATFKR
jgi:hypothetical protein